MKKIRSFLRKAQERKGFALTEMILAVLVLSGMLIVAWNLYSRIRDNNLTSTAKQYLLTAVSKTQSVFKSEQYDFESFSNQKKWVELGVWPSEYLRKDKLYNGWGGQVDMAAVDDGNFFTITFSNVPQTACVELSSFGTEWESVTINSTEYKQSAGKIPVPAKDAITSCGAEATKNSNTIVWKTH